MQAGRRQPHLAVSQILVAALGVALSLVASLGGGPSNLDGEARTLAITLLGLGAAAAILLLVAIPYRQALGVFGA